MFSLRRQKQNKKHQQVVQGQEMVYKLANLQGIGARARQEDSFAVANAFNAEQIRIQGLFFAVCDGMGGMKDGALASQTAVASLRKSYQEMDRTKDLAAQLKTAVYGASDEVFRVIGGDGGSTAVVGIIYREQLYYASVGDSYFYLLREGRLLRLNREQNLYHQQYVEEIQNGSVDPYDYQELEEAHALTEFLGMEGLDDVDCSVRPLPLREGDVLLACSDGVGGVLNENDLMQALSLEEEQAMCEWMEQRLIAYGRRNQDNYTALVIRLTGQEGEKH